MTPATTEPREPLDLRLQRLRDYVIEALVESFARRLSPLQLRRRAAYLLCSFDSEVIEAVIADAKAEARQRAEAPIEEHRAASYVFHSGIVADESKPLDSRLRAQSVLDKITGVVSQDGPEVSADEIARKVREASQAMEDCSE